MVAPRMELAALRDSAIGDLNIPISDWVDGENPYELVRAALGTAGTVAVTESMPALHLLPLAQLVGTVPVLATGVLRRLRMVKDASEIDALRKAGAAIDRVHALVPELLIPGRTEAQVAADIAEAIVAEGHSEVAFIIVGSGPHGADPHHECSDRELRTGDIVVVDIGGSYEPGYNSDSTRTYSIGEPDPDVAQRISVLERAQQAAVHAARPGVTAESVDAAARRVLTEAGWVRPLYIAPDTASGCRYMRSRTSSRATNWYSNPVWPSVLSRACTSRASGVRGSRTSSSSPKTVANR